MALPKANSPRSPVRRKRRQMSPELAALLSLGLLACLLFAFQGTKQLVHHQEMALVEHKVVVPHAPTIRVEPKPLTNENSFLDTLKSCNPQSNKKCKTYVIEGKTTERVALISPPGELTEAFFGLMEAVVAKDGADIELLHRTHIPPYGYGKTHGYSRIIRVVPHPLVLGVTTTLQSALEPGQTHLDIHMDEVKANLRQQIRFHCRLSHIAAHTALWTLTLDSLTKATLNELVDQIRSFLGIEGEAQSSGFGSDIIPPEGLGSLFFPMRAYGTSILTAVQSTTHGDILQELDSVLSDEMKISKNLSAWPCESFWTVGEINDDPLKISPRITKVAKALSPDCDDLLISCWVKRDLCEATGDGKCS